MPIPHRNAHSFGTASRTVTLDLSVWAMLYESAEIMHVDFRPAMVSAIKILFAQQKKVEMNEKSITKIPNIED